MNLVKTSFGKLKVAGLIAAVLLSGLASSTVQAAAFAIDDRNGVWGVAFSREDRQVERASERATRFGARSQLLTVTTTTATKGYYVAYAIGYCHDTARWIGAYGFGRTLAIARSRAQGSAQAQGTSGSWIVKEWLDN